jgi:hypothetical protein
MRMVLGFTCGRCARYGAEPGPDGRYLCSACRDEAIEEETRRAELAARVPTGPRVVGPQPAICEWCSEPFMAAHAGTRFCSSACRAASWRAARRTEGAIAPRR